MTSLEGVTRQAWQSSGSRSGGWCGCLDPVEGYFVVATIKYIFKKKKKKMGWLKEILEF
jgi:hypothetical protein